jgi:hypothetical protein
MNNQIKNFIEEGEKADLEYFAELEHIRWSKWQNYLHSFLVWNNDIKGWVLPHEKKEHWQSQINTPYQLLSEKEKDSDRDQVIPYLKRFSSRQISLIKMIVEMVEERINISNLLIEASENKDNFLKDDGFTNKERISSEIAIKVAFELFKNDLDTLVP